MGVEFVRFLDIDGDIVYLRVSMINAIYGSDENSCTVIDYGDGDTFYIKGDIEDIAQIFFRLSGFRCLHIEKKGVMI